MTVRFLVGPAGSGKTHRCLERLRACEHDGRSAIYLVPEQFTYSADRELIAVPDLFGLRHVRVLSFSRLAWWLHERAGIAPPPAIDAAVRPMYLRAVLERLTPETLGPLASLRTRHGLLEQLGRFIGEVRNHGATNFLSGLEGIALASDVSPRVKEKLLALGEVFQEYDGRLRDSGKRDPEEHLHGVLPLIAAEAELFGRTEVYVDGFLSWTRRESEVLSALALAGATLEIAFCMDAEQPAERRRLPFHPVARSLERLEALLLRSGVVVDGIIGLPDGNPMRFRTPELVRVERALYDLDASHGPTAGKDVPAGSAIELRPARDPYHEVHTWARAIDRWQRLSEDPIRPEQIGVFVRDVERYRDALGRIFPRFGIDYFLDERRSVLAHPRVRLLLGALDVLLSSWRRSSVVSLLRNPLLGIAPAHVDLLENLSLELGRDFERWYDSSDWEIYALPDRSRFTGVAGEVVQDPIELLDPDRPRDEAASSDGDEDDGPEVDEPMRERRPRSAADANERQRLDEIRRRVLLPLRRLERTWLSESWTGRLAADSLEALLLEWVPELSAAAYEGVGGSGWDPAWDARVDEAMGTLLHELGDLWSDVPTQPEEVARSLREGLLVLRLGVTPMRQGQVLVADVQRSRVTGIRAAIIGGVNDGVFPRTVSDDPILGDHDREALGSIGLRLGPNATERQEEEAYLFYIAMTRASDRVLVTWLGADGDGGEATPSFLVPELQRLFPNTSILTEPEEEEDEIPYAELQNSGELAPAVLARLARKAREIAGARKITEEDHERAVTNDHFLIGIHDDPTLASVVWEVGLGLPGLDSAIDDILPEELLGLVYPTPIPSSVSRLQEFASCPFRNFAGSTLRLEPRPVAKVTPLETGTLAHHALELFLSGASNVELAQGENPSRTDPPAVLSVDAIRERLAVIFGRLEHDKDYRAFQVDEASKYRWTSTRRSLEHYLALELTRLSNSGYHVMRRELPFGLEGEPGLSMPLPEGRTLLLRGKIDRLDVREEDGHTYALVVDYKRSSRTGLPASLEKGIDLQLAAYLLYAQRELGLEPAGGLYVPVLPSPPREEKADPGAVNALQVRAHGLFLAEERTEIDGDTGILVSRGSEQILPTKARRDELLDTAERFLRSYAHNQRRGWVEPRPLQTEPSRLPCDRCDFPTVCRFRRDRDPKRRSALEGMEVVQ
ncbi:MAG: PD-(D/E)XK nuclease family protein [Candidatus Eisenbacteria bacterium]|uniref:PD-(D/E)XK nuclease family protein n=1 Tax=Eiseniibacteriota bacterium TaxID=2212470 RepID=A0A956NFN4_UNCEI|nr:PD-(D/E)XK nuclease family protein [Candidatus Eisenbacteria bacterium]